MEFVISGMVSSIGANLPTVNFTYTNLWPTFHTEDGTPNLAVIVDVTPPTFTKVSPKVESGTLPKSCALCCRLRIDIELSEAGQCRLTLSNPH